MHLEQRSLIQVCDLSENQIPVISPAIWPCVCGPRTREDGPAAVQGAGSGCRAPASLPEHPPRHHSKHPPKQCPKHHPKHRPEHPPSHGGEGRGGQGHPRWWHPRVETAQGNILGMLQGEHAPRGKQDPEVSLAGMLRRWTPRACPAWGRGGSRDGPGRQRKVPSPSRIHPRGDHGMQHGPGGQGAPLSPPHPSFPAH